MSQGAFVRDGVNRDLFHVCSVASIFFYRTLMHYECAWVVADFKAMHTKMLNFERRVGVLSIC